MQSIRITALAALMSGTLGFSLQADGFGESSFEDGGTAGSSSTPAVPSGSGASGGGFGESSFDDSGSGASGSSGAGGTEAPSQADAGSGGGFGESSFDDGPGSSGGSGAGGEVAVTTDPVGGGDFPGSNVLPDTPGGGSVEVVAPEPSVPGGVPPTKPPVNNQPSGPAIDPQIAAFETRDFGVPPQNTLRQGQFHSPTPVAIPGANLVTTSNVVEGMNKGLQMVLIDVLGQNYSLPGAYTAPALASAGSFNDRTQQQASAWLQQITGGNREAPIVIFCSDPMCWLSYNATLRTVAAGYTNVYWYRGGITAWQMAGLPMRPAGF